MLKLTRRLTISSVRFSFASFATIKRSYYEILELEPNFSTKQLRKKFLEKARKYHPDHNQSKQAGDEFKLLKQAYETLKDPQKRHMYDSGISETPDEVAPVHNQQAKTGKKYYENKWHGYQKSNPYDVRDEYYQAKAEYFSGKTISPIRYIVSFSLILFGLFGYDLIKNPNNEATQRHAETRSVLQASAGPDKQTKRQALLRRYMQSRAEANKVDL